MEEWYSQVIDKIDLIFYGSRGKLISVNQDLDGMMNGFSIKCSNEEKK